MNSKIKEALKYLFDWYGQVGRREFIIAFICWSLFGIVAGQAVSFIFEHTEFLQAPEEEPVRGAGLEYRAPIKDEEIKAISREIKNVMMMMKMSAFISIIMFLSFSSFAVRRLRDIAKPIWLWMPVFVPYLLALVIVLFTLEATVNMFYALHDSLLSIVLYLAIGVHIYTLLILIALMIWPGKTTPNKTPTPEGVSS